MFSNAAYLAFLAYVVISPFVAAAALGSDTAFRVVSALNFGLTVGWALGTGSLKIEVGFRPSPKPNAPYAELTPGAVIEAPAGKAAALDRSTADIKTTFKVEGVSGVEAAFRG